MPTTVDTFRLLARGTPVAPARVMKFQTKLNDGSFLTHTVDVLKATNQADALAELEQLMHDCPDCQAARARGEVPQIMTMPMPPRQRGRGIDRFRRPRWRDLKNRRG
jgi:hypothetical protein